MGEFYDALKKRKRLFRAWQHVRDNARQSKSKATLREVAEFALREDSHISSIMGKIVRGTYKFNEEEGIVISKAGSTKKRPIIIAPMRSRVVRRAILDVLQGDDLYKGSEAIRKILATPTSVGGISGKGSSTALELIKGAPYANYFCRSDISGFFQRIPKPLVSRVVRDAVDDDQFADFFADAIATSLENDELLRKREVRALFPDVETGVAQGSSLSPLCGNIALANFDRELNGRGITCVRYIDDFLILGSTRQKVMKAFEHGRHLLSKLGMQAYAPDECNGKSEAGSFEAGFDFLGYHISAAGICPAAAKRKALLDTIKGILDITSLKADAVALGKAKLDRKQTVTGALERIGQLVQGWAHAFSGSTSAFVIRSMDEQIDKLLQNFFRKIFRSRTDPTARRRLLGVDQIESIACHRKPSGMTTDK